MTRGQLAAAWALLGAIVVAALAVGTLGAEPPTAAERVRSLSGQFACPQCDGQSVRDSDVGISREIRAEIAQRVQAGQSDDEILGFLTRAYGREHLLTPPASGASSLVWALPVALAVVAVAALAVVFRRWRPRAAAVTPEERVLVEEARRRRADGRR